MITKESAVRLDVLSDYRAACYGFCAIWIVLFHAVVNLGCDFSCGIQGLSCLNTAFSFGSFGVDIIMLLSGVSCYFSWSKKCDAGAFLRKRLMRIVPPVLLICVPVWTFFVLVGEMHWTRLLYNATLVLPIFSDGSSGVWYVAAILMLYAAYPYIHAAIYGAGDRKDEFHLSLRVFLLCILTLFGFWMLHKYNAPLFKNLEIMVGRIPTFCIGSYLGHLVKERRAFGLSAWWCMALASISYIAYVLLAFKLVQSNCWWWRVTMIPGGILGAFLICGMYCLLDRFRFVRPVSALVSLTGSFSLELYVAHVALFWFRNLCPSIIGNVTIALILSCLSWFIAYLVNRVLYVWFDRGIAALIGKRKEAAR